MTKNIESIVQLAVTHFKQGHYQQAKTFYQQAAEKYGPHLFANSIRLCELRMKTPAAKNSLTSATATNKASASAQSGTGATKHETSLARQLEETQKLLERYFKRCQELEYQLLDR